MTFSGKTRIIGPKLRKITAIKQFKIIQCHRFR